jgi:hypothetical protein
MATLYRGFARHCIDQQRLTRPISLRYRVPRDWAVLGRWMLTREILFGFNIVSLVGFLLMGIGLTLNRQQKVGVPIAFTLMGMGTVLVFFGLYVAVPAER